MAESVAANACRHLSRQASGTSKMSGAGAARCFISTSQKITGASRVRPATLGSLSSHSQILPTQQHTRQFHLTSITNEDIKGAAATPVASANPEAVAAPFASPKVEELFQKIIWLDMIEVHLLAELINEKMGITISEAERQRMAQGGGRAAAGGGGDAAPAEAVEEKTIFDLKLTGFDAKAKIKVIKEVRAMTSLGLKEAKELVEGVPSTVKKDIKKEEAEELKAKLEGLGGQVEIV